MNLKNFVLGVFLASIIGYSIGRWATPPKVETKVETVEKEVVKREVEIVEREVTQPDGTKVVDRTTKDKSTGTKESKETQVTKVDNLPKWHISGGTGIDIDKKEQYYSATVERYIFNNISAGVTASSNKQVGVVIGISF